MCVCVRACMRAPCACSAHTDQKNGSEPPGTGVTVVRCHVGTTNCTPCELSKFFTPEPRLQPCRTPILPSSILSAGQKLGEAPLLEGGCSNLLSPYSPERPFHWSRKQGPFHWDTSQAALQTNTAKVSFPKTVNKKSLRPGVAVCTFNPSTWDVETGRFLLSSRPALST